MLSCMICSEGPNIPNMSCIFIPEVLTAKYRNMTGKFLPIGPAQPTTEKYLREVPRIFGVSTIKEHVV